MADISDPHHFLYSFYQMRRIDRAYSEETAIKLNMLQNKLSHITNMGIC